MTSRTRAACALAALLFCLSTCLAWAQPASGAGATPETVMPSVTTVPAAALPSDHFGAEAATDAYLAQIPATARTRSDAYFEGGYWLILWDFLYGVVVALLLLNLRWSAAMRNLAERITRFKPVQTFLYWMEYLVVDHDPRLLRSRFTKATSASISTGWPPRPSARGWATRSRPRGEPGAGWNHGQWCCSPSSASCREPGGFGERW